MQTFLSRFRGLVPFFPLLLGAMAVPVVIIPFFSDAYEMHKAMLVMVAATLSGMLFLGRALREKTLSWSWSSAFFAPMVFFAVALLSAFASLAPHVSFLGLHGADYMSVLFLAACMVFVFLLTQMEPNVLRQGLAYVRTLWIVEACVVLLLLALAFARVIALPAALSFGTPHALAYFIGIVMFLVLAKNMFVPMRGFRVFFGIFCVLACLAIAFLLDAWVVWIPILGTALVMLGLALARVPENLSFSRSVPIVTLVLFAGLGWILPGILTGFFPAEIVPSFSLSGHIAQQTLHGWRALWGIGGGTYGFAYALHALPSINATDLWNVTFERSASHVLTTLTTLGIFGALAFASMQVTGIVLGIRAFFRVSDEQRADVLGALLAFFFLSIVSWVYTWNVLLVFLYFFFFGVLCAFGARRLFSWTFVQSARASVGASFAFVGACVVLFGLLFFATTRYLGEIAYARAISLDRLGGSPEDVLREVNKAASLNQWDDVYYRELSLLLLGRIDDLVTAQVATEQVQSVLSAAVQSAQHATGMSPYAVLNWEVQGNVYREVAVAVTGASDFSIAAFERARELAPTNPRFVVGLGRAYLAKADIYAKDFTSKDAEVVASATALRSEALARAEEVFLQAIELKSNYTIARYFLAGVYERQDRLAEAIQSMEVVRALDSKDVGAGMQLALLYMRQGKQDLAQAELERIIVLSPTFANARWYLSVLLEQKGDIAGAILQVQEVARLNPENTTVQDRLVRLQSGTTGDDTASEVPEPLPEDGEALLDDTTLPSSE